MFDEMREDKFSLLGTSEKEEKVVQEEESSKEYAECIFLSSDSDDEQDEVSQDPSKQSCNSIHDYLFYNSFSGMLTPIPEVEDEYNDSSTCLSSNDDRKKYNDRCFAPKLIAFLMVTHFHSSATLIASVRIAVFVSIREKSHH